MRDARALRVTSPRPASGTGVADSDDQMADQPAFSIVVPLFNEEENVRLLVDRVRESLAGQSAWELLLVDDGSTDGTALVATEIARIDARVRVIRLARNFGQTSAMQAGFDHAAGRIVVSMDGDLQNDPRDIPLLIRKVEEGFDLVAAYRVHRQDKLLTRKVPSWIANRLIRGVTGVPIRDNGCSLKAYRRELLDRVHLYSDMHRFIPAVAAATAGARIAEIPVRHHARRFGRSKYGLSRVAKVFADLLAIKMIRSFRERPLTLFGIGAAMAMLIAFAFAVAAATGAVMFPAPIADAIVLPGAALLWFGLAFYLLMLGLIAEAALRRLHDRDPRPLPLVREAA